jgi:putative acetyltransferase
MDKALSMANVVIRDQTEADFAAVHDLVTAAFKTMPHACGREQFLMDALWRAGAATAALVAEDAGAIVGQVAFSKVKVGGADVGWHGCGPLSVLPERHKQGIGGALMRAGLARLRALGSKGCVLVGDPAYYPRFGFKNTEVLRFPGAPPEVFMTLSFSGETPSGEVEFDKAFEATE